MSSDIKVIMTAKEAKRKADEKILLENKLLIDEYTKMINDRILESVNNGKYRYGAYRLEDPCLYRDIDIKMVFPRKYHLHFPSQYIGNKYLEIADIVEAEFEKNGYVFDKRGYADYFYWHKD